MSDRGAPGSPAGAPAFFSLLYYICYSALCCWNHGAANPPLLIARFDSWFAGLARFGEQNMNRLAVRATRPWRTLAALLAVSCLALLLAACGGAALPAPAPSEGSVPVEEAETVPQVAEADRAARAPEAEAPTESAAEADAPPTAETESAAAAPHPLAGPFEATEDFNGIPVGFTPEGFPFRGNPDAAVTMIEYSDYQCPFCARYFVQTEPALNEAFVRNGTMRVVFRDYPIVELHPNAPGAHIASLCVAEQGAAKYWQMHGLLFRTQDEWAGVPDPSAIFERLAGEAGADLAQYMDCVQNGDKAQRIEQGIAEAQAAGFNGSPSFRFLHNESGQAYDTAGAQPFEEFALFIETVARGEAPATAQQQSGGGGIPFWATAEGLTPDPDRPGLTAAGDQYRGDPNAPIAVVEFSDFQCPYCLRHVTETQPALDTEFVDTGEVFWVFKHFPLNIHPQAPAAAAASECASDQGKFWEMHELLFANVESWSVSNPNPELSRLAGEAGLDVAAFDECLPKNDTLARVQSDLADGAPFVQGTPTFIVLFNGEGRIIPGALPAEQFSQALNEIIALAEEGQPDAAP